APQYVNWRIYLGLRWPLGRCLVCGAPGYTVPGPRRCEHWTADTPRTVPQRPLRLPYDCDDRIVSLGVLAVPLKFGRRGANLRANPLIAGRYLVGTSLRPDRRP